MRIERTRNYVDDLELADGDKTLTIHLELEPERIIKDYRAAQVDIMRAYREAEKSPKDPDAVSHVGDVVLTLFTLIFGERDTQRILDFYDGQYSQMVADILPYISGSVGQAVERVRKQRINNMRAARKSKPWRRG